MKKTFGIVIALLIVLVAARTFLKNRHPHQTETTNDVVYDADPMKKIKRSHMTGPMPGSPEAKAAAEAKVAQVQGMVQESQQYKTGNLAEMSPAQKVNRKARLRNSITKTMNKVYSRMGQDKAGELAALVILRSINEIAETEVPKNLKSLCKTQATCPMRMAEFYNTALSRLDPRDMGNVRVLLQKSMLDSDLPINQKQSILYNELTSNDFRDSNPESYRMNNNKLHLSQTSMALVLTQEQFFSTKPDPRTAINASLTAIRNTQDKAAQVLLMNGLTRRYPEYSQYYTPQLESLGVSSSRVPAQSRR